MQVELYLQAWPAHRRRCESHACDKDLIYKRGGFTYKPRIRSIEVMDDLLKKYGGITHLKKHMMLFYERVCEDKSIKHYFFGINPENIVNDQGHFRTFVMRKLDHMYRETPPQTGLPSIRVKPVVFDDVMKTLQRQLKAMGVHWREIPRMACHVLEVVEETRSRAADTVKTSIDPELVTLELLDELLKRKHVHTRFEANGDLHTNRVFNLAYPFWIRLDLAQRTVTFIGRFYAYSSVGSAELAGIVEMLQKRWTFMAFDVKQDAEGWFIETRHVMEYGGAGIPIRMFFNVAKEFSWRLDELINMDKDERLINVVKAK